MHYSSERLHGEKTQQWDIEIKQNNGLQQQSQGGKSDRLLNKEGQD